LKILFLTLKTFSATGGIEKFNRSFAAALWQNSLQLGWQIQVVSAYDGECNSNYFPSKSFAGFSGRKIAFAVQALKSVAEADVIVIGHINLASLVLVGKKLYPKKKWLLIAHGREVWSPLSFFQKKTLGTVDQIWSVSRYTSSVLSAVHNMPPEKMALFPNTLDPFFGTSVSTTLVAELRNRYGLVEGNPVLITVARLANTEKNKGYDEVLDALPHILKYYPQVRYLLCGKPDEEEKNRILLRISELNLQKVVILTGFIDDLELNAHYHLANIFVMPSSKEGFGIVFIEAAWRGLQVIAGNRDGSVDALLDGKLGKLVTPGNRDELQSAILGCLKTPLSLAKKLESKRLVEENYGFDKFMERQKKILLTPRF
jgi:phosphatidylinositol alpha-1,6-mannosyltransferase